MQNWTVQSGGMNNTVAYSGRDALSGSGVFFVNGAELKVMPATVDGVGLFFRLSVAGSDVVLRTDTMGNATGLAVNGVYQENGAPLEDAAKAVLGNVAPAMAPIAPAAYQPPAAGAPGQPPAPPLQPNLSPYETQKQKHERELKNSLSVYLWFAVFGLINIPLAFAGFHFFLSAYTPFFIMFLLGVIPGIIVGGVFLLLYFLSKKSRGATIAALVLSFIDAILLVATGWATLGIFLFIVDIIFHVFVIISLFGALKSHKTLADMAMNPQNYQTMPDTAPPVYGAPQAPPPPYSSAAAPAPPTYGGAQPIAPSAPNADIPRFDPETGQPIAPSAPTQPADIPRFDPETGQPLQPGVAPGLADTPAHADGDPTIK